MAWTTPKTWSAGETLTAANFNTHIRDNLNAIGARFHVRKTTDTAITSDATLNDDPHLLFAVAASEVWAFNALIKFNDASAGAADIQMTFTVPAGATGFWACLSGDTAYVQPVSTAFAGVITRAGNTAESVLLLQGLVVNAGTAGNLTFQWAQQASNAAALTVRTNSYLIGEKLA